MLNPWILFESKGSHLRATFTDSGPGVPLYRADQIFGSGASTHGLGLGLGLSRELARAMDGDLTLQNPGDAGASFTLTLPAGMRGVAQTHQMQTSPEPRPGYVPVAGSGA